MSCIDLEINEVKNIKQMQTSFPLDRGLYALVGENGCGKSTIMLALSLIVKTSSSHMIKPYDISPRSNIKIQIDTDEDIWFYRRDKLTTGKFGPTHRNRSGKPHNALIASTHMEGFYEGSIFMDAVLMITMLLTNLWQTQQWKIVLLMQIPLLVKLSGIFSTTTKVTIRT